MALNIVSLGALADQVEASTAAVLALRAAEPEGAFLDLGAGGGFPGLWVAACHPCPGVLVEPRARRADFLELSLAAMGRRDWSVVRARFDDGRWVGVAGGSTALEELQALSPGVVSARAVWSAETWWAVGSSLAGRRGLVMMHVRPGALNPAGAEQLASSALGGWEVRLLRSQQPEP